MGTQGPFQVHSGIACPSGLGITQYQGASPSFAVSAGVGSGRLIVWDELEAAVDYLLMCRSLKQSSLLVTSHPRRLARFPQLSNRL